MTDETRDRIPVSKMDFVSIDQVKPNPKDWLPHSLIYKVCDDKTMLCVGTIDKDRNFVSKTPPAWFINETLMSGSDIQSEVITFLLGKIQDNTLPSNIDYVSLWERYQKEILESKRVILKGPNDGMVSY